MIILGFNDTDQAVIDVERHREACRPSQKELREALFHTTARPSI